MRTSVLVAVVFAFSAVAASAASSVTPSSLAQRTAVVFNQKLAFAHTPVRVRSVRCLRETPTYFYCIGKMWVPNTGELMPEVAWNVTVKTDGTLVWSRS